MKKCFSFLIALTIWSSAFSQNRETDLQHLRVDVVYLASNMLEGRETGKKGESLAAQYIAERFAQAGLQPKGNNGTWYHTFDFKYNTHPHGGGEEENRTGTNVVGFLDNGAATTVVIGAHYDHLGMGLEGSSLNAGEPAIHNGADDNASGVAAMLLLAGYLKNSSAKHNNYLFIAFSGEEMGLFGSKNFVNAPTIDLDKVNYMLNMDMVGRLNEEKVLAINGAGTSPAWKDALEKISQNGIKVKTTDSGVGPSDHTSFYLKDIPVLHFFTGQHSDYHKPSDDSELVNYEGIFDVANFMLQLIEQLDNTGKLAFTKTKDEQQQAASFKVTLGVMPDYVYDGEGMRIDAVLDDRPAKKAGLEGGDVIIQIGDKEVKNIYDYMDGLALYKKGDKTKVKVKRKNKTIEKEVEF
ncbi:MAG: M20/M25/M40 family metallo-hydrolase [Lewinellaceae bacterium]|nr:M20/M25/M40 family metallo-hydrolase [Saprospiraceae bacterium]MCB9336812.1 M20/M25/M40 family metallo-hydrolase [Lewinellaceae bacterium]